MILIVSWNEAADNQLSELLASFVSHIRSLFHFGTCFPSFLSSFDTFTKSSYFIISPGINVLSPTSSTYILENKFLTISSTYLLLMSCH